MSQASPSTGQYWGENADRLVASAHVLDTVDSAKLPPSRRCPSLYAASPIMNLSTEP